MIYILIAAIALLAIAYIVYLVLDLMSRRKFAEQYSTWEPDLDSYYRKRSPYVRVANRHTDREEQEKADRICEILEDLCRMQGRI